MDTCKTDIELRPYFFITRQVYYDTKALDEAKELHDMLLFGVKHFGLKPIGLRVANFRDWRFEGLCWDGGREIHINNRTPYWDKITTLGHEMVHAIQYQDGRLKMKSNRSFWEGSRFDTNYLQQDYNDTPWEVEAYEKQDEMAEFLFKNQRKLYK